MNNHILILFATFSALSLPAVAQMDNVVEVEAGYTPTVKDANKINVLPDIQSTSARHYDVQYSLTSVPTGSTIFQPMYAAQSDATLKGAPKGFATIAGGNDGGALGRVAYGYDFTADDRIDLDVSLRGVNGKVPYVYDKSSKWQSRMYTTSADVDYTHRLVGNTSLTIDGKWESQVFNYQPMPMSSAPYTTDKQHNTIGDVHIMLSPYVMGKFSVGAHADYRYFGQKYVTTLADALSEHHVCVGTELGYALDSHSSIDLDADFHTLSYSIDGLKGETSLHVVPHYNYRNEAFDVKAGLFVETTGKIAPDVHVTYHVSPQADIFVEASGGEVHNTLSHLSLMTPYWALGTGTDKIESQFDILRAKAGLRITPMAGLSATLYAGYDISEHRAELIEPLTSFSLAYPQVVFADGKRLYGNLDVRYDYKDIFGLDLHNQFNSWTSDDHSITGRHLLWRPVIDLDWSANLQIIDGLRAGVDARFQTFKGDKHRYERPNTLALGASLSYTLTNMPLSIYLRGDNLIGKKYDQYYMYRAQGAHALLGVAYTF